MFGSKHDNDYWMTINCLNNMDNLAENIQIQINKRINNEKYTNGLFDKIYLLNVDKHNDRLKDSDEELKIRHINYTRYSAVDGTKITANELIEKKIISPKFNAKHRPGSLGLAATHYKMLVDQVLNNHQLCLYFEDDIRLHHQFCDQIAENWQYIPDDADIISLSHWFLGGNLQTHTQHITKNVYKLINNINSAACIAFTLKGAHKMLEKQFPILLPLDNFDCKVFNTYIFGKIDHTDPKFYIDTTTMPNHKIQLNGIAVTREVPTTNPTSKRPIE